jgi:hypothetical protein
VVRTNLRFVVDDNADDLTPVDLSPEEREVLRLGLLIWGGPAAMTDEIARTIWFADRADFYKHRDRLRDAIRDEASLSPLDWHRALAATEVGFISKILGAGGDWHIVSGIDDHQVLDHIRAIQAKLAWVRPWPEPYARPQAVSPAASP